MSMVMILVTFLDSCLLRMRYTLTMPDFDFAKKIFDSNKFKFNLIIFCALSQNYIFTTVQQTACIANGSISKNTWLPRAFSSYSMHDLVQEKFLFHAENNEMEQAWLISFFTEYMQNFGSQSHDICTLYKTFKACQNLGSLPFWSGTNVMTVGNNTGAADLDAYQIGMGNVITGADGIAGSIQLNPKIQQVGTDCLIYYVHKREESSFFFKIHLPLGAMMINPNLKQLEPVVSDDQASFTQTTADPASSVITYQFPQYPAPYRRPATILDAFCGGDFNSNDTLAGNRSYPIRLRKGRIAPDKQTVIGVADLSLSLGYNFVIRKNGNFGIAGKVTCPTGNVPTADYMLEPIFGRGGVWGVGAEAVGFYNLWLNDSVTKYVDLWWQAEILHLLPGRTPNFRSFDLKQNGVGSKYLLIQSYSADPTGLLVPYVIEPAVNVTTMPVLSTIPIEGSIAFMLDINYNNWNAAIGAEFWGRSAEQLQIDFGSAINLRLPDLNNYVVLGRQLSGYDIDGQATELFTYYCEPLATISKSQDPVQLVGSVPTVTAPTTLPDGIKDARLSVNRIPAKLNDALDIASAQALKVFSGKLFSQFGYTWIERCYAPSLSLVAGIEFSNGANKNLQFWSIGFQWSLSF